jgi:hypothetical protein
MKKKAIFWGNCHNTGMVNFMQKSKQFEEVYEVHQYANWMVMQGAHTIDHDHVKTADLFLYQPLQARHGEYSTDSSVKDSIGSLLKPSCKKVSFPYTYYSAFWPISQAAHYASCKRWYGSEVIECLRENLTDEDIISLYDADKIDWEYSRRHAETISILRQKEEVTDIKISSFIEENMGKRNLFLIPQHPTSLVFLEKANQALQILGMDKLPESVISSDNECKLEDSTYEISSGRWPLHTTAINHFGMKYTDSYGCTQHGNPIDAKQFYRSLLVYYMNMFSRGQSPLDQRQFEENYIAKGIEHDK